VPPYFGVDTCAGAGVGAGVGAGAGVGVGVGLAQLVINKANTKRSIRHKYSFFILPPENKKISCLECFRCFRTYLIIRIMYFQQKN
jgi:hypothetical protein